MYMEITVISDREVEVLLSKVYLEARGVTITEILYRDSAFLGLIEEVVRDVTSLFKAWDDNTKATINLKENGDMFITVMNLTKEETEGIVENKKFKTLSELFDEFGKEDSEYVAEELEDKAENTKFKTLPEFLELYGKEAKNCEDCTCLNVEGDFKFFVYGYKNMEDIIAHCKCLFMYLGNEHTAKSISKVIKVSGTYYLVIKTDADIEKETLHLSEAIISNRTIKLLDYSSLESNLFNNWLNEYGKVIVGNNAIEVLAKI